MTDPIETRWAVITGPPSSGKTTLLSLLSKRDVATSADSTRQLIAEVVASGRDAEEFRFADDFQPRVLDAMLTAETALDPATVTALEYALPCNIAFHRTEWLDLTPGLAEASTRFRYAHVFICDPVGWATDAERVEDEIYQQRVHRNMLDVYNELGYEPIRVPAVPPEERLDMILRTLDT